MPPTKKTIGFRELRVGLFVIIAIAVLIFLILQASATSLLRARFV